jgi:hypothetical protein
MMLFVESRQNLESTSQNPSLIKTKQKIEVTIWKKAESTADDATVQVQVLLVVVAYQYFYVVGRTT